MDKVFILVARYNPDEFGFRIIQVFDLEEKAENAREIAAQSLPDAEYWILTRTVE